MAMEAPPEKLAYVALLNGAGNGGSDGMATLDVDPGSKSYGRMIGRVDMPGSGDELHHFAWNACSSCLCPYSPHPQYGTPIPHRSWTSLLAHSRA